MTQILSSKKIDLLIFLSILFIPIFTYKFYLGGISFGDDQNINFFGYYYFQSNFISISPINFETSFKSLKDFLFFFNYYLLNLIGVPINYHSTVIFFLFTIYLPIISWSLCLKNLIGINYLNAGICSLLIVFSPWSQIITYSHIYSPLLVFFPLLVMSCITYLNNQINLNISKRLFYIFLISLLINFQIGVIFHFSFSLPYILFFFIFTVLLYKKVINKKLQIKKFLIDFTILLTIILISNIYFFTQELNDFISSSSGVTNDSGINNFDFKGNFLADSIRGMSFWALRSYRDTEKYYPWHEYYDYPIIIFLFIAFIFYVLFKVYENKTSNKLYFFIFLFGLIIATGSKLPFGEIYKFIISIHDYFIVWRHPSKHNIIVIASFVFILAILFKEFEIKNNFIKIKFLHLIIYCLTFLFILNYQINYFSNKQNNYYGSYKVIPDYYFELKNDLSNDSEFYNKNGIIFPIIPYGVTYNWDNKTTFLDSIVKDFLYDNNLRFINDHPRDNEIRLDYINIKSQKKFKEFQNKYLFDYILIHRDFIKNKQKYLNHNEIIKYLDQDFKVYKNYYQNKKIVFSIYKKLN